jgi:hypothetical protein
MLPKDIVIPFNGDHADIPANFVRETRADGRNIKSGNSYLQGGNSTHTHTSTAHTHQVNAHTHTLTFGNDSHTADIQHQDSPPEDMIGVHYHGSVSSGGISATTYDQNASPNWSSASNTPPSRTVIFIRATKIVNYPVNAVVLRQDKNRSLPYFTLAEGKYLRGASTGQNAGENVGANQHGHDVSHTHTPNAHSHITVQTGTPVEGGGRIGGFHLDNPSMSSIGHRHQVTINSGADTPHEYTNENAGSTDIITLTYQELYAYLNDVANGFLKENDIAFWFEETDLPRGWELAGIDSDRYIKIASESSGALSNGGSLTHQHSSVIHTHTADAHNHTASMGGQLSGHVWGNTTGSYNNTSTNDHTHPITVATVASTRTNGAIDCSEENHEPEFVRVRVIKATKSALIGGGGVMQQHLD